MFASERRSPGSLSRRPPRWGLTAACAATALVALVALVACDGLQRFPICHTDQECAARESAKDAPVCFNLKCVACRYDTDCATGEVCTGTNRCDRLGSPAPEPAPATPESSCAARCKDDACVAQCTKKTSK